MVAFIPSRARPQAPGAHDAGGYSFVRGEVRWNFLAQPFEPLDPEEGRSMFGDRLAEFAGEVRSLRERWDSDLRGCGWWSINMLREIAMCSHVRNHDGKHRWVYMPDGFIDLGAL